jgi:hypothetical protein
VQCGSVQSNVPRDRGDSESHAVCVGDDPELDLCAADVLPHENAHVADAVQQTDCSASQSDVVQSPIERSASHSVTDDSVFVTVDRCNHDTDPEGTSGQSGIDVVTLHNDGSPADLSGPVRLNSSDVMTQIESPGVKSADAAGNTECGKSGFFRSLSVTSSGPYSTSSTPEICADRSPRMAWFRNWFSRSKNTNVVEQPESVAKTPKTTACTSKLGDVPDRAAKLGQQGSGKDEHLPVHDKR